MSRQIKSQVEAVRQAVNSTLGKAPQPQLTISRGTMTTIDDPWRMITRQLHDLRQNIAARLNRFNVSREIIADALGIGADEVPELVGARWRCLAFARAHSRPCDGATVRLKEFYDAYVTYCDDEPESLIAVSRILRVKFTIGRGAGNLTHIANVTLDDALEDGRPLVLNDKGQLCPA
jgi:hypothetical protein